MTYSFYDENIKIQKITLEEDQRILMSHVWSCICNITAVGLIVKQFTWVSPLNDWLAMYTKLKTESIGPNTYCFPDSQCCIEYFLLNFYFAIKFEHFFDPHMVFFWLKEQINVSVMFYAVMWSATLICYFSLVKQHTN